MSQSDFVTRGQSLVASGQFQEAVKVCRLGLLGRPTTVEGRIVLGQALLALKRFDEVLAEMRVALELDHSSLPAQALKAEALLKKGDRHAANEVLVKLRPHAEDPKIAALLAEAERGAGRPSVTASHPAVGFLGPDPGAGESLTKHYPNRGAEEEITGSDDADIDETGGHFTRPTSLQAPGSKKRSGKQQAMDMPSPDVLAVGDKSGTMEVDPEADALDVVDDDDFGDVAPPPSSKQRAAAAAPVIEEARGFVKRSTKLPKPMAKQRATAAKGEVSSVELDSGDMLLDDAPMTAPQRKGPGKSAVRNAVKVPSGPLDAYIPPLVKTGTIPSPGGAPAPTPASTRPTAIGPVVQPPLAHQLAQQPHVMNVQPPAQPLPPAPMPYGAAPNQARMMAAVNLPTVAGMQPPSPQQVNAARPTLALSLNPAQQQSAAAVDALFGADQPQWAKSTVVANQPPGPPLGQVAIPSPIPGHQSGSVSTPSSGVGLFPESPSTASGKPLKTGVRKGRGKLAVAMWILVGAVVIGGGVFAGFQIRAMRLKKQIAAARDQAVEAAKSDTWLGWSGARDRLAGIAQASGTIDNRSALARARAVLAYEFGDGVPEAKTAVEHLAGETNVDLALARAYVALAQNDPAGAKAAADKASELAKDDAAALYVSGQAELLNGDYRGAIASLKSAVEHERRPLYAVGLARAIGVTGAWDEALQAVEGALAQMPDHPSALIERAFLAAGAGRIAPNTTTTAEIRTALVKLTAEGAKPFAEQTRGVSPAQVALADLALAQIDFALRDMPSAINDLRAVAAVGADEQRVGEEATDTLLMLGELQRAKAVAGSAIAMWPGSRRVRIAQAQIALALGAPRDALDILAHNAEAAALPRGLAVRGEAKAAIGDLEGARADLDAALKKLPKLEIAVVGRAWIDLAQGDLDEAKKRVEPMFNPATASIALSTVWAETERQSGEVGSLDKARAQLEKVVKDAPSTPEVGRAELELGRVLRDIGDLKGAAAAFASAIQGGSTDARLESGLLMIEDHDPHGGHEVLEQLLKDAGGSPPASLLLETARSRMLDGDNAGAGQLLDLADKAPSVLRWQYDRERGRLALRRYDIAGAAQALLRALDNCDRDAETFLLAADTVSADPTKQLALAAKLKAIYPLRLKDLPEAQIVTGKLALASEDPAGADKAYKAAIAGLAKATPRRLAQAHFGLAAVFYSKGDFPSARDQLAVALPADPTLYVAYLFSADVELNLGGPPAQSKALDLAKKSVAANPDYVDGWVQVGTYAAKLSRKKDLDEAITRVGALAPSSDSLKELEALRKTLR